MKTKHFFNVVMAALLAVIFSALTGCTTAGAVTGGAVTADAAVKQLVADLNAIKPESAKVNGNTITLTGKVEIETALTVPEGVTLDLTAEGAALELRDGAVLTVNGTVNAAGHGDHGKGWIEGSLRTGDGTAVITGTGTIYLKSKGRLLNIWGGDGKMQLTLDGVTLVGLPDNDNPLVGISENGEFVLKSGAITGNTYASDEWAGGGGVEVYKGTFTMEGGAISGNSVNGKDGSSGGGVQIGEESVFTMKNGTISGNTANDDGGGVSIGENAAFTMKDGTISGNIAANGHGGGVAVYENATFTMEGGDISGNTAKVNGGGVFVNYNGKFTMENGTISGNTAAYGGGVRNRGGSTFSMKGGRIQGNTDSDGFTKNSVTGDGAAVLSAGSAKWGMGGTYTRGGVSQTGGSDIAPIKDDQSTVDDTLIAIPGQ